MTDAVWQKTNAPKWQGRENGNIVFAFDFGREIVVLTNLKDWRRCVTWPHFRLGVRSYIPPHRRQADDLRARSSVFSKSVYCEVYFFLGAWCMHSFECVSPQPTMRLWQVEMWVLKFDAVIGEEYSSYHHHTSQIESESSTNRQNVLSIAIWDVYSEMTDIRVQ